MSMSRKNSPPAIDPPGLAPALPDPSHEGWSEDNSLAFLDYGRFFVPDREEQIAILVQLVPHAEGQFVVLDLGCGDGLLAQAILEAHPQATVVGLDRSATMLHSARERLARFGRRFATQAVLLEDLHRLRQAPAPLCVVSSLAIHHLDASQKQGLFREVFAQLLPGGTLAIADLMAPAHPLAQRVAADAWDESVRSRSLALSGSLQAYEVFLAQRWNAHRYLEPDDIDKPSGLAEQLEWLGAAGFVDLDVCWMRAGHAIFGGRKPPVPGRRDEPSPTASLP
jgi:tRNA (cmo5U34)-methyltransferase